MITNLNVGNVTEISARDMKAGQLGVITTWVGKNVYQGKLVQRMGFGLPDLLIVIGDGENYWDNCGKLPEACKVRILSDGQRVSFAVSDNQ